MPKVVVNDISMYYEIHGKGDTIVFVSGFGADHLGWTPILDLFAKEYQVVLLCNRGAGQTDVPEGPYTIAQLAADVIALCNVLRIQSAHFVGNSMGGQIVQMIAYQYPSRVKSIVIGNSAMNVNSVFRFYLEAQLALIQANAPLDPLTKALCAWLFSNTFLSKPGYLELFIELRKNNPYPFTTTGYEGQCFALTQFDSREWIQEINVPALVLTSDQDIIFRPATVKALAAQIKNAAYFCFQDNAHLPHIEQPKEYFEVVKNFLGK